MIYFLPDIEIDSNKLVYVCDYVNHVNNIYENTCLQKCYWQDKKYPSESCFPNQLLQYM